MYVGEFMGKVKSHNTTEADHYHILLGTYSLLDVFLIPQDHSEIV